MAASSLIIHQLGLLILTIFLFSFGVKLLRQPIIIGYVASGILFSFVISDVAITEIVFLFGELGILFLLFTMGIEFDLSNLKAFGKEILFSSVLQSVIFFAMGYGVSALFNLSALESLYIGIAFMFSSTLLVAKWLEDKKETQSLHGKLIITTLIIQDILAIVAITVLQIFGSDDLLQAVYFPLYGVALFVFAFIFGRYFAPKFLEVTKKFPELILIFSLGICFLFAEVAALLKYSPSIGAFVGGIVLGSTIYRDDLIAKLSTLVIFFNMLFFVGLGFQVDFNLSSQLVFVLITLFLISIIIKPLIFYITFRLIGFNYKTSLHSGLYLGQASEFGIIILLSTKGVNSSTLALIILLVISTMVISSYSIKYSKKINKKLLKILKPIDTLFFVKDYELKPKSTSANVIFFGYSKDNYFVENNSFDKRQLFVVENDPSVIKELEEEKIKHVFCSTYLSDFLHHVHFKKPEIVISNMKELSENKIILNTIKEINKNALVILYARNSKSALKLYEMGADFVVCFEIMKNNYMELLIEDFLSDVNTVVEKKMKAVDRLKKKERIKKLEKVLASKE